MKIHLKVWRQATPHAPGRFERYTLDDASPEMTLLEALDRVNENLVINGTEPVAFDSDCREGICGACGMLVDGVAHGPARTTTVCQLTLHHFNDGAEIRLEPFRARAFPLIKDLVVDRSSLDRLIAAGGYVSVRAGSAAEANAIPIAKADAERALDAAQCIGCGACVAACPNASASLFVAAKVAHLAALPQGKPERRRRALAMVQAMDAEGFGGCSLHGECAAVCPKGIELGLIPTLQREWLRWVRKTSSSV
jgi:succinate dehydrogenase / fumarate reductase iron-sulfur subunit